MPSRSDKQPSTVSYVRWTAAVLLLWMILLPPSGAAGGAVTGSEYDVKIGFIYNFAKFVTWPKTSPDKDPQALVICYVTDDPAISAFAKLDGKTIKNRKIKVIAYEEQTCLEQSQIIFFAIQDKERIQQVLAKATGRSILTIGEVEGFTRWGGIINFFEERNRLRFKINISAARREGLKMSSQLLGSAQIVQEGIE